MADRYEIKGRLGRGGIGAVYQAFDHHLGRDVAIKRLLPIEETLLNDSAESTLESEAKTLAALQHPNIVTIFEFGEDEQGSFVVFELIDGDTLKEVIDAGALSETDFYEVADQILDALVAAQKMNIMHRDIKPANIMLSWLPSGKFQIKMLDFGLSKFAQEPSIQTLDQQGSFLGSIDYIAPEQIELFPLDQRTDLYSLGCVLYFALTQRAPFTGGSMAETMNNHLAGKAVPLEDLRPDIPIAVCRWVMALISLHPSERPDDALAAMTSLAEAKEMSNQSLTDSIPTAKLVVPVVETAQPTMQPRILQDTQQIVTTPAPMDPVIPPHPQSGYSKMITGRYKPKPKADPVSRKAIFGLVGSILALIVVCGIIFAEDRKSRKKTRSKKVNAAVSTAKTAPPPAKAPAKTPISYENSGVPDDLPGLPSEDSLVAYYSVLGKLRNKAGSGFDFLNENESLGAIENAVPGAHRFHLVKSSDLDEKTPKIVENWSKAKTIQFLPGQKLSSDPRVAGAEVISAQIFTFAILFKISDEGVGTLFRTAVVDGVGMYHNRPVKLAFFRNSIVTSSENVVEKLKIDFIPKQYMVAIIELNAEDQTVSMWAQSGRGKSAEFSGGDKISIELDGPFKLKNYEFGNSAFPKNPESRKRVEMPAVAIYKSRLSDGERKELGNRLFDSLRKP